VRWLRWDDAVATSLSWETNRDLAAEYLPVPAGDG
jgi:hypothetical protein